MMVPAQRADAFVSDITFLQTIRWFNFRSDRDDFCVDLASLSELLREPGVSADVEIARRGRGVVVADYMRYLVPSAADFAARRYAPLQPTHVCRVSLDPTGLRPPGVEYVREGLRRRLGRLGVDLPARPEAVPLLRQFPCGAEVERLAASVGADGADGAPPRLAAATGLVRQLAAEHLHLSPLACLGHVQRIDRAVDLDWRADNPPPADARCEPDLTLMATYYDRVFSQLPEAGLGVVTRADLDGALAAFQDGDPAACLIAAARVRRAYFAALSGEE